MSGKSSGPSLAGWWAPMESCFLPYAAKGAHPAGSVVCPSLRLVQCFEKRQFLLLSGDLVSGLTPNNQAASEQIGGMHGVIPCPQGTGAAGWSRGHRLMNFSPLAFGKVQNFCSKCLLVPSYNLLPSLGQAVPFPPSAALPILPSGCPFGTRWLVVQYSR